MNFLKNIIDFLKNIVSYIKEIIMNISITKESTKNPNTPNNETQNDTISDNDKNYVDDPLTGKFDYWVKGDGVRIEFKEQAKIILKDYRKEYGQLIEEICSGKKTLLLSFCEIEKVWELDAKLIECGFVIRTYDEYGNVTFLGSEILETKQDILDGKIDASGNILP